MLDGQSGEIRFDEPAVAISPQLTRAEFLASPLCRGAKISVKNEPYCTWELRGTYRAGVAFLVSLCFRGQALSTVSIADNDPKLGTSWDDWSEAKELARKAVHDRWLGQCVGAKRTFGWGKVSSNYDPRDGASTICIELAARTKPASKTGRASRTTTKR